MKRLLPALWLLILLGGGVAAQEPSDEAAQPPPAESQGTAAALDRVRELLVQLELEKALAALEPLLADAGLTRGERAEALTLRAQTHAAFGDFDAAEEDYGAILRLQPRFVPERTLTPRRAMERFEKVRDALVGTLRISLSPADAKLRVDGQAVVPNPDGTLPLLAGDHTVVAEASGCDPESVRVTVEAGKEMPLQLQLLPNARTLIVRSTPPGAQVLLDGVPVGVTELPRDDLPPGSGRPVAELVLPNVPLGDHVLTLSKPCYRDARIEEFLTVDLLDRTARRLDPVTLEPASSALELVGGPAGAQVAADGAPIGVLPLEEPLRLCPGEVTLSARLADRVIWSERTTLDEAGTHRLEVRARPNLVLAGRESWPVGWDAFAAAFSTGVGHPLPAGDPARPASWRTAALPPGTDLVLAVVPAAEPGGPERWLLASPILGSVSEVRSVPARPRPSWYETHWGFEPAGSRGQGACVIVRTDPAGPAAGAGLRPGDTVEAVDGEACTDAAGLRAELRADPEGTQRKLRIRRGADTTIEVELRAARSPVIGAAADLPDELLAAWAAVDAVTGGDAAPAAWSNLASLLARYGETERAVEAWRRVRFGERAGLNDGTAAYWLGTLLARLQREEAAIEAFRRAAASAGTARRDGGEPVAPAARDHLADLGVASER